MMCIMRIQPSAALVAALVFFALPAPATAWRHYLQNIPNSNLIPCPDPTSAGCLGGYCEAVGHDGCSAQGDVNDFGDEVDSHGGDESSKNFVKAVQGRWGIDTCTADSDADGYTNGDETGDFCCAWNGDSESLMKLAYNGEPVTVTNPAWDLSKPSIPSCSLSGPPGAPLDPFVASVAAIHARLGWARPSSCVCEYQLQLYDHATGASSFMQVRGDRLEISVCSLQPVSTYDFTVVALNRAGRSDVMEPSTTMTFTTLAGNAGTLPTDCVNPIPADLNLTYTIYMNTIPAGGYVNRHTLPYQAPWSLAWIIAPTLVLFIGALLLKLLGSCQACKRPHDAIFQWFVAGMCCKRGWQTTDKARMRDFSQSSRIFSVAVAAAAVFIAGMWVHSSLWYADYMRYSPAQVAGSVWRGSGYALAACMGLQILPVTRWSPWMKLVGLSFERGLTLHRWVSAGSFILAIVHGVGIAVMYSKSPLGIMYLFRWNDGDLPVNPLAGTLAGFAMIILGVTAWAPIRRWCYELFLAGHALYPFIFALSIFHTRMSESAAMPLLLPGIILLAFDHIAAFLDLYLRPVQVIGASIAGEEGRRVVKLECEKNGMWRILDAIWPFHYEAGQYIYAIIPAISVMPHPFSISSVPDASRKGFFTLHIREMGGNSFTSKLAELVQGAAAYAELERPPKAVYVVTHPSPKVHAGQEDGEQEETKEIEPADIDTDIESTEHEDSHTEDGGAERVISAAPVDLDVAVESTLSFQQVRNISISMWVSGPFGIPTLPLNAYDHFVLIAGGIGITPIASLHEQLVNESQKPNDPSTVATEGTLLTAWAVREVQLAADFLQPLGCKSSSLATPINVKHLYCSTMLFGALPESIGGVVDQRVSTFAAACEYGLPGNTFSVKERLSAVKIVDHAVERVRRLRASNGSVDPKIAIVVCGAQSLVDDAYAAAAKYPQAGSDVLVHIHKELFAF
jgi:predicted ferric reductase